MSTRYAESGHAQNDLVSPFEIASLVRRFYSRVSSDDLLGPVFNDVAQVDWSEHLPKLTAFWSRVLLDIPGFNGAPMQAHHRIHAQHEFTSEHFHRWLDLFFDTLANDGGLFFPPLTFDSFHLPCMFFKLGRFTFFCTICNVLLISLELLRSHTYIGGVVEERGQFILLID